MKRIFALAIVGVLSITSLAEARSVNKSPKPERVQRSPSSARLTCPDKFVKIEDAEKWTGFLGDFCITEKVQDKQSEDQGEANCKKIVHSNRKAFGCNYREWVFACRQNKDKKLKMGEGNGGSEEWVFDPYGHDGAGVLGKWGCNGDPYFPDWGVSYGYRCCYR
jgi:hypothetical protein